MNKTFKSLIAGVCVGLIGILSGYPITQTFTIINPAAQTFTNLIPYATRISQITITTPAGTATNMVYRILDSPLSNATYDPSNGFGNFGYTNIASGSGTYATNFIRYTTNFGWTTATYSNTVSGVYTYTNITTNIVAWTTLAAGTAASNATITTWTPATVIHAIFGVGWTNSTINQAGTTVTIIHQPDL